MRISMATFVAFCMCMSAIAPLKAATLQFDSASKCTYAKTLPGPDGNYFRTCYGEPGSSTILVEKFAPNGKLDVTWGMGGRASATIPSKFNCSGKDREFPKLFFPPDGRVLSLGGTAWSAVAFSAKGTLDREYGVDGLGDTVCPFPAPSRALDTDSILSVDMQLDGRLVAVANSRVYAKYPSGVYFSATRLTAGGKRDTAFGSAGNGAAHFVDMPASANSDASRVLAWSLQQDGSFQAAYFLANSTGSAAITLKSQYDSSDTAETIANRALPQRGVNYYRERDDYVWQYQPDGGLLFKLRMPAGQVINRSGEPMLIRFLANGQMDTAYGINGGLIIRPPAMNAMGVPPVNCAAYNYLSPGVIQMDGTIVFEGRFGFGDANTGWGLFPRCASPTQTNYVVKLLQNGTLADKFPQWGTPGDATGLYSTSSAEWTVVEYFNSSLDRYFMTPHPGEQAAIDADDVLRNAGWRKTGRTYGVWNPDSELPGTASACRFAADPIVPPKSFYDSILDKECNILREQELATPAGQRAWRYDRESLRATPPVDGVCPSTLIPIYSLYNQGHERGIDSNFRYVDNLADFNAMIDRGWVGLAKPQFCARPD